MSKEKQSPFSLPLLAGVVVVGLLVAVLYWVTQPGANKHAARISGEKHLPFGEAEKLYAERIHISDIKLSQATNLIRQEFTYVAGILANDGARTIRDIELTVEFRDQFNQVVLRETQRPFGTATKPGEPLPAGQPRDFVLTVEHVPVGWNRQYPSLRVSGLVLE